MDIKKIKQLIDVFENSKLAKLDLEVEEVKIKMEKPETKAVLFQEPEKTMAKVESQTNLSESKQNGLNKKAQINWIKSPLVGTFYSAPAAGAEPFIKIGDYIKEGDLICIIEAMKVMNEIKADKSGYVVEIKAVNGEMVEYDQEIIALGDKI